MTNPYSALDIAAYLIKKCAQEGTQRDLTPLKLQKILYFAQGWYLANYPKPLFKEAILAWRFGPVIREVYDYYRNKGVTHITPADLPGDSDAIQNEEDQKYLDNIWAKYGNKSAFELVGMTHLTDPWITANEDPVNDEIDPESMRVYFGRQLPVA